MAQPRSILDNALADLVPENYLDYTKALVLKTIAEILRDTGLPQSVRQRLSTVVVRLSTQEIKTIDGVTSLLLPIIRSALEYEGHKKDRLQHSLEDMVAKLDEAITKYDVLRYHEHYGILITPDPNFKKLPSDDELWDLSKGVPEHMLHAMLADPQFCLVYVTGSGINTFGHALIFLGDAGFIHIAGGNSPPQHMTVRQFNLYLNQYKKSVLGIQTINLPNINDSIVMVCNAIDKDYFWGVVKHNCIDFCHGILKKGGYEVEKRPEYEGILLSLPTLYLEQTSEDELRPQTKLGKNLRPSFDNAEAIRNMLATTNILSIDVTRNYMPDDMIKFVKYILENIDEVILLQKFILINKYATAQITPERDLAITASENIRKALSELNEKIEGKYRVLFNEPRYKAINNYLKTLLARQIQGGMARLMQNPSPNQSPELARKEESFESVQSRFFGSSAEAPKAGIQQEEDVKPEASPKKSG